MIDRTLLTNVPEMMLGALVEKVKKQNWLHAHSLANKSGKVGSLLSYQQDVLQSCLGLRLQFGEESSQLATKISLHNTSLPEKWHSLDSSAFFG